MLRITSEVFLSSFLLAAVWIVDVMAGDGAAI